LRRAQPGARVGSLSPHSVIPPFSLRSLHERLTVVRVRLPPAEDVRGIGKLARVARWFDGVEPGDQLLVKVSTQRQRPAGDLFKGMASKRKAGVKASGGILLLQTSSVTAEHDRVRFRTTCDTCLTVRFRGVASATSVTALAAVTPGGELG